MKEKDTFRIISRRTVLICFVSLLTFWTTCAQTSRNIHVATAGTLPTYISDAEKYNIEELTLTGELNGTDFRLLRDMAGNNYLGQPTEGQLKVLDFSGARVVAGGEKYLDTDKINFYSGGDASGSYHYSIEKNDELPQWGFAGCKLISVNIPNSVTSIGDYAFYYCSGLTSVTIGNSVTSIGSYAFMGCSGLTSVNIPNSVTSIGDSAFNNCSELTSATIGNSVTSIGIFAFSNCSSLTNMSVASGNTVYDSRNNCNAIIETLSNTLIAGCKNTVIPNSVKSIGIFAFSGCSGLTSVNIPISVTSIGDYAFYYCSGLTSVTIPNSVTSIGSYAFQGCPSLTSVTIGNSVTSIGGSAFSHCSSLTSVSIPNSVTNIGADAFSETGIYAYSPDGVFYVDNWVCGYKGTMPTNTSISLTEGTVGIADYSFKGYTNLKGVVIPNTLANIGYSAFSGCSNLTMVDISDVGAWCNIRFGNSDSNPLYYAKHLYMNGSEITELVIPKSVTSIADYLFYGSSNLTTVTFSDNSVTSIGKWAFSRCSQLASANLPNSLKTIGDGTFSECKSLKKIVLPEGFYLVGLNAFWGCNNLEEITFPNSLVFVGNSSAYNYCYSLKSITSKIRRPSDLEAEFPNEVYTNAVLTVPYGTKSDYQSHQGWNKFVNIIEDENLVYTDDDVLTVHVAEAGTLSNYISESDKYNIYDLTITGELNGTDFRVLRDMAGHDCYDQFTPGKLKKLNLTNARIVRGGNRYLDTDKIHENAYWSGNYSWGENAFRLSIEEDDVFPKQVFRSCMLEEVSFPISSAIDDMALYGCRNLKSVTLPNSVTNIGNSVFSGCRSLTSVISEIVEPFEINNNVFSNYDTATLTVPYCTKAAYQQTAGWNNFTNIVEAQANIYEEYIAELNELEQIILQTQAIFVILGYKLDDMNLSIGEQTYEPYQRLKVLVDLWSAISDKMYVCFKKNEDGTLTEEEIQQLQNDVYNLQTEIEVYESLLNSWQNNLLTANFECNPGGTIALGAYKNIENNSEAITWIRGDLAFTIEVLPAEKYKVMNIKVNGKDVSKTSFSSTEIDGDFIVTFAPIINEEWLAELQQIREEIQKNTEILDSILALDDWYELNYKELYYLRSETYNLLTDISSVEEKVNLGTATEDEVWAIMYEWQGLNVYYNYINLMELTITSQGGGYVLYGYDERVVRDATRHIRYLFPKPWSYFTIEIISDDEYIVDSIMVNGNLTDKTKFYSYEIEGDLRVVFRRTELPLLTLTAQSYSREYGDENPDFGYSASLDGIVGTPQITCHASAKSNVGTYPIVISKGSVDYENVSFVDGTLTITKAPLTITAEDKWMRQGEAVPALTAHYDGFKLGETESVFTTKPRIQTTATTNSPMGDYAISVSGAVAQNYQPTYVPGLLTVIGRRGDVNRDGYINARDLADIIQYTLGHQNVPALYDADLNSDEQVTIADITSVINCIMGNDLAASRQDAPTITYKAWMSMNCVDTGHLMVSLTNNMPVVAFQFDVLLSEGNDINQVMLIGSRVSCHDITFRKMDDGICRVLAYSMPVNTLLGSSGPIASLQLTGQADVVTLTNIHVADDHGNDYALPDVTLNLATDISTLSGESTFDVYDLNGRLVRHNATTTKGLQRGIYIINNTKVVIK